jgi:superfamily II DNA or RNA helicase/diadenosine tetraphosphate (Ap4A) HIT family hydrolase
MSEDTCPFCTPPADRIFFAGRLTLGLWDNFPVNPGHALLVLKRHVASWFDATTEEQAELLSGIAVAQREIERDHRPDGYNVGINIGSVAGQTVFHVHVHVIPRYAGDARDPRGGVRSVVPGKANYLTGPFDGSLLIEDRQSEDPNDLELGRDLPHVGALITGDEDPLLPHVRTHLDRAVSADFAVAFLLKSGVALIGEHLRDLLGRGGRVRIVTGTYLDVTDPDALLELLDVKEQYPDQIELRVFEADKQSFHPKAYLFYDRSGAGTALVGSSNLTRPALTNGVEWNFRTLSSMDRTGFSAVQQAFDALLCHPRVRIVDADWLDSYQRGRTPESDLGGMKREPPPPPPEPHGIQKRALRALELTRADGNSAGLVVLATGLGKTWLAAFDSKDPAYRRVLFVAHREEILRQAMDTYRRIRPKAHLGLYTGQEKTPEAEVIFASIQTLGRSAHLERFTPTQFDYVVVDEFHHAAARTYRRLIDYFEPKFLLGLTATPERTDGGDLLALCQENLVFRCDVPEGIREGLLSPFHYFGVPDEVNYENIPWRSNRFDEEALTEAVSTRSRAQNAFEQYQSRGGAKTLAFCCSTRHADFMRQYFREAGVRAAAVHSGTSSDPRAASLERLGDGELEVIFTVDMFNEGVDLPDVDTVMMLRPTASRILWLQQFGRGLRKAEGKERLNVIDYIGNHRTFLLKLQTLFDLQAGDAHIADQLTLLERGNAELPPGCGVTYELEVIDILRGLLRLPKDEEAIRFYYEDFRERYGVRPTASEMHHDGYLPRSVRKAYGSWFGFINAMGDLATVHEDLTAEGRSAEFLSDLETTPMTRSYKMLVLLVMLHDDCLPGEITVEELREGVRRLVRRSAAFQRDLSVNLDDDRAIDDKLRRNPIAAWVEGKGTGNFAYFAFQDDVLRTTFHVEQNQREAFSDLIQELADWRLAEYLDRPHTTEEISNDTDGRFVCKVSHSGGRPILFLPPRDKNPSIPSGWTPIQADGNEFEAKFVKVAVNIVRQPDSSENVLEDILRNWFGENAGLPGTSYQVQFERSRERFSMTPLLRSESGAGLEVGRSYMRAEIPPAFDLEFKSTVWQQGFVFQGGHVFLLVTLDKTGMPQEHRYGDRFLSPELFEWKSQNRHTQEGTAGQTFRNHAERGVSVHLLVRKTGKISGKAAPFIYCGDVEFVDWEGERPITVRWRLKAPLPARTAKLFGVN